MITDIITVLGKEEKELLAMRGSTKGGWMSMLIFVGVFGIFMPLQTGRAWVEEPITLLPWVWLPFLLVSGVVADSFAGERERHTLETLLASRLSDRAILFGKLGAAILYGWGLTVLSLVLGLITVNLVYGQGELLIYPGKILAGLLTVTFLVATLSAGLGVFVSLRSATVRQAQQTFSIAFFLLFVPVFLLQFLPVAWQHRITQLLERAEMDAVVIAVIAVLIILDLGLILGAMARFRRARLILD